jgi:hypothetical protein
MYFSLPSLLGLKEKNPVSVVVGAFGRGNSERNFPVLVAVPPDRDANPVQEFGCWTADLKRMAAWLTACRIDTVAIQATGVYSIPLYDILTGHGIRVVLVNAHHTKNVPAARAMFRSVSGS